MCTQWVEPKMCLTKSTLQVLAFYKRLAAELEASVGQAYEEVEQILNDITTEKLLTPEQQVRYPLVQQSLLCKVIL